MYELLEYYEINENEAIAILYELGRKRLVVQVEYDKRTLTQYPIIYDRYRVGWDFPERISQETIRKSEQLLRQIRAEVVHEPYERAQRSYG